MALQEYKNQLQRYALENAYNKNLTDAWYKGVTANNQTNNINSQITAREDAAKTNADKAKFEHDYQTGMVKYHNAQLAETYAYHQALTQLGRARLANLITNQANTLGVRRGELIQRLYGTWANIKNNPVNDMNTDDIESLIKSLENGGDDTQAPDTDSMSERIKHFGGGSQSSSNNQPITIGFQ